ncbi:Unknown protein sequence [Pseudomonas syringae pv. cilantro]|uniref:Uncharacterized protein n=1 Tax=Pseudomonas syringae pv. cilantro TaxID=81035 RepID=A0A0N0GFN6_PSESX|nr:Unknown protein sequence [Pseudomonas syringae pv. cilantro]
MLFQLITYILVVPFVVVSVQISKVHLVLIQGTIIYRQFVREVLGLRVTDDTD